MFSTMHALLRKPEKAPYKLGYTPSLLMHLSSGGIPSHEPLDPTAEFDPIDGGHLNVKLGKEFAEQTSWAWMKNAYRIVVDGDLPLLGLPATPPTRLWEEFSQGKFTCGRHAHDFCLFSRYGVLHEVEVRRDFEKKYRNFVAASKFFPVPKKNNKKRAIIDSRDAGALCGKPPPVNLPPVPAVIRTMASSKYFWAADLRHWFYQIPIHTNLQPLFSMRLRNDRNKRMWQMSVLPMGWSWSPFLAQCIAWSIILYRNARDKECLYRPSDIPDHEVPSNLPLRDDGGNVVGQIILWYDNILISCEDEKVAVRWKARILQNALALSAMWGEDSCPPRVSSEVDYIGIHAHYDPATNVTQWCHTSDKCDKALTLSKQLESPSLTPRTISQAVGYAIWDHTLRLRPLAYAHEAIDLLRTYCGQCTVRKSWDATIAVPVEHRRTLQSYLATMQVNAPLSLQAPKSGGSGRVLLLASDAGGEDGLFAGIVRLGSDPESSIAMRRDFPPEIAAADISIKELWAAVLAIETWSDPDCDVILGVDSVVARAHLRHGLGHNKLTNDLLRQLYDSKNYRSLKTMFVYSEDNVADPPSRGDAIIDDQRFWASHRIISGSHVYAHCKKPHRNLMWPCDLMTTLAQDDFLSFRTDWSIIDAEAREILDDLLCSEDSGSDEDN